MHTNKTITKYGAKYLFALPEQASALDRFVERHEEKILAAGGVVIFSITYANIFCAAVLQARGLQFKLQLCKILKCIIFLKCEYHIAPINWHNEVNGFYQLHDPSS